MLRISKKSKQLGLPLYPFQTDGLEKMLTFKSKYIYNADEMGLGKTVQALVYANSIKARHLLVVCPASLRLNWLREAGIWYDISDSQGWVVLSSKDYRDFEKQNLLKKGFFPSPFIVSYDLLVRNRLLQEYCLTRKWDLIIMDEADGIRNLNSKRTNACMQIWDNVDRALLLSGTPIQNCAIDLYPPLSKIVNSVDYLDPEDYEVCSSFQNFSDMFAYKYFNQFGITYSGVKNPEYLKDLIHRADFFIRRKKVEVLKDLPSKTYARLDLNIKIETSIDSDIVESFLEMFEENESSAEAKYKKHLATFKRELGEAKAQSKELYAFIEDIIKSDGCVVIFFYHISVKNMIYEQLSKKYKIVLHYGDVSAIDKQKSIDAFQAGEAQILLAQSEAAVGYTAHRASKCVFIEYPWLPAKVDQAIDRIHRIGQDSAVVAYFTLANNSLDIGLFRRIVSKAKAIQKVIE